MAKKDINIPVEQRAEFGNGPARRLRRSGRVPAIIYGHGEQAVPLLLTEAGMKEILHHTGLVTLTLAGQEPMTAVVKDVQRDSLSGAVLHADFQKVRADEVITIGIRLEAHGDPAGIQMGGQLEQVLRNLEVRCKARDIFESLSVDVSAMNLNDTMHVSDLKLPAGIEVVTPMDAPVFQVRLPKMDVVEEEKPAEGAEAVEGAVAAEPEVIAKGKKPEDEEGAAGATPAPAKEKGGKEKEKK